MPFSASSNGALMRIRKKDDLFPNSTSYATTRLTNKVEARTHSHLFSWVRHPSERTVRTCRAWNPMQRVFLTWFYGSPSDLNGFGHWYFLMVYNNLGAFWENQGHCQTWLCTSFQPRTCWCPWLPWLFIWHTPVLGNQSYEFMPAGQKAIFQGQNCSKLINTSNF